MNYAELAETVTARIVAKIEAGAGTWEMPWYAAPGLLNARNATTSKPYSGSNWLMLALAMDDADYPSNWWATFKQWTAAGAQVRKGEHGTRIVKWVTLKAGDKPETVTADDGTALRTFGPKLVPKVYVVFNAAQVDGWTMPGMPEGGELVTFPAADAWIEATGADIIEGTRACYRPEIDQVELPIRKLFKDGAAYYSVAAHELVHWSGHKSRIARDMTGRFGSDAYAAEELVAELGSAMACAGLNIEASPRDDHAAYLSHWLRILKADPKALFTTASAAGAAVTHLDQYSTTREDN